MLDHNDESTVYYDLTGCQREIGQLDIATDNRLDKFDTKLNKRMKGRDDARDWHEKAGKDARDEAEWAGGKCTEDSGRRDQSRKKIMKWKE
uniref:Lipoprotein n=1 Tax=Heterorhabditis bacteriophora TaxID=37862 RepID=A0A1I7X7H4_HETBA